MSDRKGAMPPPPFPRHAPWRGSDAERGPVAARVGGAFHASRGVAHHRAGVAHELGERALRQDDPEGHVERVGGAEIGNDAFRATSVQTADLPGGGRRLSFVELDGKTVKVTATLYDDAVWQQSGGNNIFAFNLADDGATGIIMSSPARPVPAAHMGAWRGRSRGCRRRQVRVRVLRS